MPDSGVRLSEVLVALSTATDLGLGQPAEHMVRSARIGLRLAERLGVSGDELATLYDVSLLTYVGCPVFGHDAAALFGDDIDFRARAIEVDLAGREGTAFVLRRAATGSGHVSVGERARRVATVVATGGRAVAEQMAGHCAAAGELADRLGLDTGVRAGIEQSYARWDGRGVPRGVGGDALSPAARIAHVAQAAEVYERLHGPTAAVAMLQARRGGHFDPAVVDAACRDAAGLFARLDEDNGEILSAEPLERASLDDAELDAVLLAIADFGDLRCAGFAGHSRATGELVGVALTQLGRPPAEVQLARRAAWIHDLGRFGVPASILAKPGPLNHRERERMRLHAYYVDRIFDRPDALRRIAALAATHHERLDGSGYPRGLSAPALSMPARVLAVADSFHAMTQPRPHRPAWTRQQAAQQLRDEVRAGRLDADAVDAVLGAAGEVVPRRRAAASPTLTEREAEVLRLLAQGLPNKAIARSLTIAPKTVGNHVEHIYTKLGVSNRAAATMRAVRDGLV